MIERRGFTRGDRVWYEPSEGIRFAGVVEGPGTLDDCYRVLMTRAYWAWRGRGREHASAPAISSHCVFERAGWRLDVDNVFDGRS